MSLTLSNMGLTAWNAPGDFWNYSQLAANWSAVDAHDHTPGKGVQIPTGGIANLAIDASKLATGAVTNAKIGALAVDSTKIADGSITTAKIATNAVDATRLANGAVGTTQLATNAVQNLNIQDGAVNSAKIAANAISVSNPFPLVTVLTGTPVDGQTVRYQADATNGINWLLAYRAGSPNSQKWEYLGGPCLSASLFTDTPYNSATGAYVTSSALSVVAPLAGAYAVEYGLPHAYLGSSSQYAELTIDIAGTGQEGTTVAGGHGNAQGFQSLHGYIPLIAITAGAAIKLRAKSDGSLSSMSAYIRLRPIRVG